MEVDILGSTGSIGVNALQVAKKLDLKISSISANTNIALLAKQAKEFSVKNVCIIDESKLKDLKALLKNTNINIFSSKSGLLEMLCSSKSSKVLNAIIGFAGINASLKVLALNKNLLLANKESLVIAGSLLKKHMDLIVPIDSEHFSLWILLKENSNFKKLYISASGGALRDMPLERLKEASLKDVLAHPNWSMGDKITIDSASMVNKIYELIEGHYLFNTTKIDALIERSSLVHALIELDDLSLKAHISSPNMQLPIFYAFKKEHTSTKDLGFKRLDIEHLSKIRFEKIDPNFYKIWAYKDLFLQNQALGVVLNASNELALEAFLNSKISFLDIQEINTKTIIKFNNNYVFNNLEDIELLRSEVISFCNSTLKLNI